MFISKLTYLHTVYTFFMLFDSCVNLSSDTRYLHYYLSIYPGITSSMQHKYKPNGYLTSSTMAGTVPEMHHLPIYDHKNNAIQECALRQTMVKDGLCLCLTLIGCTAAKRTDQRSATPCVGSSWRWQVAGGRW
jgi:hypothetical protein